MSKFFINRPIVAMVISILMVIIGSVTIVGLPIALFPQIAPPEVQVSAIYTGADAQTIEQSVATPIEQQMSGVDNMNYMYSLNATANGQMRLIVDFDVKTDPNTDLILADLRENLAQSQLPAEVNAYGITVTKTLTAPLLLVSLNSPHSTYDAQFLANYAYINLNDQLTRVPGIGSVQVFGAGQYAMRLWVKPDQLAKLGITVPDIVSALQTQNTVNPAGQVGGEPVPKGQEYTYSVLARKAANVARRVRTDCGEGNTGWRDCAREGCSARGARLAGLLHRGPPQRKTQRHHRRVPTARFERRAGSRGRKQADVAANEAAFPAEDLDYDIRSGYHTAR
jgi:HAE1 family hydrophobic/amphiphilic exporter-1